LWVSKDKVPDAALGTVIGPKNLAEIVSVSIMQTVVPKYMGMWIDGFEDMFLH
jgi:hypothetical protein